MPQLALVAGYIVVALIGLLGLAVVWKIFTGKIDLRLLVSEKDGPASMSRFQLLIFTFAVGMCVLVLTLESGEFPKLDANILGLIGISSGSYLISKGIQKSKDEDDQAAAAPKTGPATAHVSIPPSAAQEQGR